MPKPAKIGVRNVRRDGNDHLKKLEKDGDISQDEHKKSTTEVQTLTDRIIKEIDELLEAARKSKSTPSEATSEGRRVDEGA